MAFSSLKEKKVIKNLEDNTTEKIYDPIVVLELYTSQGCSSCPSADLLLNKIKKEYKEEVYALSYHVDYWNYIGWKDPFSKPDYTNKQRFYNIKFKNRSNYTPQLVVNGKEHFVGSNRSKMYAKVNAYRRLKVENKVIVSNVMSSKTKISFTYAIKGNVKEKSIRAALVLNERTTLVSRGENRNKTLKNNNIVVAEKKKALGENTGELQIPIPTIVKKNEKIKVMVFIENSSGDITGATRVAL